MNSTNNLQGTPPTNSTAATSAAPGQLPNATLGQIQQQVDPTQPKPITSNGIWLTVVIAASIIFVIAALVVGIGLGLRKRNSTAS